MSKFTKAIIQISLVVVILLGGVAGTKKLISMKKKPVKKELAAPVPLVEGFGVHTEDVQVTVTDWGTVQVKTTAQVVPQVSGMVESCSANFVDGGFFKAGEPLITIDQRDYLLAVESADAAVARSQVALDVEEAEAAVARDEWDRLHPGKEPTSTLVLREPQIREAKANVNASTAQLKMAQLALERTVISMPFDGRVSEESVDVGQYLMPGQSVATVYATDVVEIIVPMEDKDLAWFDVPSGYDGGGKNVEGAEVAIKADFGGKKHGWEGRVVRTTGRIDATSRMVSVVIEVQRPFDLVGDRPALVPGMFVEVQIQGRSLKDVIRIPRHGLRSGSRVWVNNDGRLKVAEVTIARLDDQYAYITDGLEDGDVIVVSPIDAVTDNMAIRTHLLNQEDQGDQSE